MNTEAMQWGETTFVAASATCKDFRELTNHAESPVFNFGEVIGKSSDWAFSVTSCSIRHPKKYEVTCSIRIEYYIETFTQHLHIYFHCLGIMMNEAH